MDRNSRREFVRAVAGSSLAALAGGPAFGKDSIPLIVPGKAPVSVFVSPEASLSERWAAEQLSMVLGRMTGVGPPIITSDKVPDFLKVIAVGRSAITDRLGADVPGGESCLLRTAGETLILAGGRQRGTMYGVFSFLEKLGCRWFTEDAARIPQVRSLWVPPFDEISHPAFEYREVFFTEAQGKEWSARNRLNGHFHHLDSSVGGKIAYMPFAHSFYDLVPPDRFFAAHPEYFSLFAGKRRGENAQLCLTNDAVVDLAVTGVEEWLRTDPEISVVSVSQNDGGGWCECEPCRQAIREEGGAASGLLLRFVNRVARRIAVSHPDKIIDTLAYQATADPPSVTKPLPNVQIRFCPIDACQGHSYLTCAYNRRFKDRLAQWARIAPKLILWNYSINFAHYLLPFPNEQALISDIPELRRAGVSGIFVEGAVSGGGGGEDAELRSFLAARLLWNQEIDANAEIRGFLNAVYGPAAAAMSRYFRLRHQEVGRGRHLWIDQNMDAPYLTEGFLRDARILLVSAARQARSEPARRRIERHLLSVDYPGVMRRRKCRVQNGNYGPDNPEGRRLELREFARRTEELGISHLREGYPLTQHTRDLYEQERVHPVVALDNGTISAAVVPELGGRVVLLGPSGGVVNLLRVPDPGELAYPNAGGLYVSLGSGYLSRAHDVAWSVRSASMSALTLEGRSETGLDPEIELRLDRATLFVGARVVNPGPSPVQAVLRCQAEFAFAPPHKALLSYTAESGAAMNRRIEAGDSPTDDAVVLRDNELPRQELVLSQPGSSLQISNTFRAGQVARYRAGWSFRGSPQLSLSLWSPEAELQAGDELILRSEYQWLTAA